MTRMPVGYVSHGAPPLADDETWTTQLAGWSAQLEKPTAILVVSAHWEAAPLTLGATATVPLTYDFWGFAERYYEVQYPAPGAPALATRVRELAGGSTHEVPDRGLDHGAYVPLVEMYPAADVPTLQVSLPTLDPAQLIAVGRRLAPLRDEGVLILGSGFFTHNLREMRGAADETPPSWSAEFDEWGAQAITTGDLDALIDFEHQSPAGRLAHPRTEHFAPLFVALGAALGTGNTIAGQQAVIDGFWYGLSKRSYQFD